MNDGLAPPRKSVELEDPGSHDLTGSSDADEHFSDAPEGQVPPRSQTRSRTTSPVPITRVERVDDKPSHGEVPGTAAYEMRSQDAAPDELRIVPESSSRASEISSRDQPPTPGGLPIPKTVVEKVDPDVPGHGDVPGTDAYDMRRSDAAPDVIVRAPEESRSNPIGMPTAPPNRYSIQAPGRRKSSLAGQAPLETDHGGELHGEAGENELGEGFDEFEAGEDDEFGDFDDGFQQAASEDNQGRGERVNNDSSLPQTLEPLFHIPEFNSFDTPDAVIQATQPFIDQLFPNLQPVPTNKPEPLPEANTVFLTDRSLSLWSQLVAPPPLQPPDWTRSRTRRLFLVSLGVPVDLDEILPASKQKKLILPSVKNAVDSSLRSEGDLENGTIARLKQDNGSSASVNSSASKTERKRRGPPPPPNFDPASARILCTTTETAMQHFTSEEFQSHIQRLRDAHTQASQALEYYLKRKDSAIGEKEAFEGVIENLVKHAKKARKRPAADVSHRAGFGKPVNPATAAEPSKYPLKCAICQKCNRSRRGSPRMTFGLTLGQNIA